MTAGNAVFIAIEAVFDFLFLTSLEVCDDRDIGGLVQHF